MSSEKVIAELYMYDNRTEIDLEDGHHMVLVVTEEGIIVDLYDYEASELVGTFAQTFTELAEMILEDSEGPLVTS